MIQKKEKLFLNVAKGVLIILMLWGHCIQYCAQDSFDFFENSVFKTIYSFHMPLFMLISGYLFFFSFQKRDLKELLIHRTQSMLQPIVFASMLNSLLVKLPAFLMHGTLYLLDGELLFGIYSLWFLWCVLSASVAVAIPCKLIQNPVLQLFGILMGILLVVMFPDVNMHLFMYPYFVIGFLYGKYKEFVPEGMKKLSLLSLPVFPVMLFFYEKKHYIYNTPVYASGMAVEDFIGINGFRWAIGLVGCIFVLTLLGLIFRIAVKEAHVPTLLLMIAKLGENSLAIYCLSVSLLSCYLPQIYGRLFVIGGENLFAGNMLVFNYVMTPIVTVAYCFGLYGLVWVMKKCRLHALIFGR